MSVRSVSLTSYGTMSRGRDVSGEGNEKIEVVAEEAFNQDKPHSKRELRENKYQKINSHSNLLIACGLINIIMGYACWILALRSGGNSTHYVPIMLISLGGLFLGRGFGRKETLAELETN